MAQTLGSWLRPPFGSPEHIVKYLGQYTHRVAISNQRIQHIDKDGVLFYMKDYADQGKRKLTHLSGVEFLHRYCLHILCKRFVRIRYYGILSSKIKKDFKPEKQKAARIKETPQDRLKRLTQFDVYQCPYCKIGRMQIVEVLPRIRSPGNVLYPAKDKSKSQVPVNWQNILKWRISIVLPVLAKKCVETPELNCFNCKRSYFKGEKHWKDTCPGTHPVAMKLKFLA